MSLTREERETGSPLDVWRSRRIEGGARQTRLLGPLVSPHLRLPGAHGRHHLLEEIEMNPRIPLASVDHIPIYAHGTGAKAKYFVIKPKSRKRLPRGSRVHCYAISMSAAERLVDIFNYDLKLRYLQPARGRRAPTAGGGKESYKKPNPETPKSV